jgi:histidine ammonia-lyase
LPITLDGSSLTIEKLVAIARNNEKIELDSAALERIRICRAMLEEKLAAKEIMYGTNTGIGEFSEVLLSDEQVKEFQKYLICNHAAGIGEPAPAVSRPQHDEGAGQIGRENEKNSSLPLHYSFAVHPVGL